MSIPPDTHPKFGAYAHPAKLVSTQWLVEHGNNAGIVVVESDEDVLLYETGHIAGAVKIDWHTDLQDPLSRDYLDEAAFAELMSVNGITQDTTVVFYGDNHNWWATYALWVFELFGHTNARLLDGGRQKWLAEGRPLTTEPVSPERSQYPVVERNDERIRAFRDDVMDHFTASKPLVDVRSPEEFRGELLHMADYPQEGALRGGHIPGAHNVPWKRAAEDDGAFKPRQDLEAIYHGELGIALDDEVVTYCRIGERSSHTWFVLTYLLGHDHVRNYDGSWTEWGNLVRAPIERP